MLLMLYDVVNAGNVSVYIDLIIHAYVHIYTKTTMAQVFVYSAILDNELRVL